MQMWEVQTKEVCVLCKRLDFAALTNYECTGKTDHVLVLQQMQTRSADEVLAVLVFVACSCSSPSIVPDKLMC